MNVNRSEIISIIKKIYRQEQAGEKSRPPASPGSTPREDSVEISSSSELLKKEMARMEGMDSARAERVAELARQVQSGQYRVDSRELADIILSVIDKSRGI